MLLIFLDNMLFVQYSSTSVEATHTDAAVAQSVERRIGSAEVTGPIPVSSFVKPLILLGFREVDNLQGINKGIRTYV